MILWIKPSEITIAVFIAIGNAIFIYYSILYYIYIYVCVCVYIDIEVKTKLFIYSFYYIN